LFAGGGGARLLARPIRCEGCYRTARDTSALGFRATEKAILGIKDDRCVVQISGGTEPVRSLFDARFAVAQTRARIGNAPCLLLQNSCVRYRDDCRDRWAFCIPV